MGIHHSQECEPCSTREDSSNFRWTSPPKTWVSTLNQEYDPQQATVHRESNPGWASSVQVLQLALLCYDFPPSITTQNVHKSLATTTPNQEGTFQVKSDSVQSGIGREVLGESCSCSLATRFTAWPLSSLCSDEIPEWWQTKQSSLGKTESLSVQGPSLSGHILATGKLVSLWPSGSYLWKQLPR